MKYYSNCLRYLAVLYLLFNATTLIVDGACATCPVPPQGPQGAPGPQGNPGPQGDPGDPGTPCEGPCTNITCIQGCNPPPGGCIQGCNPPAGGCIQGCNPPPGGCTQACANITCLQGCNPPVGGCIQGCNIPVENCIQACENIPCTQPCTDVPCEQPCIAGQAFGTFFWKPVIEVGILVNAPVPFDEAEIPPVGITNSPNGVFTLTNAGTYFVTSGINLAVDILGAGFGLFHNGVAVPAGGIPLGLVVSAGIATVMINAAAGDTVELRNSALLTIIIGGITTANVPTAFISIFRIN